MKQPSVNNNKKQRSVPTPTQQNRSFGETAHQDYDQDRFYYNNDEDTREVLSEVLYNLSADEEQRVSKYW